MKNIDKKLILSLILGMVHFLSQAQCVSNISTAPCCNNDTLIGQGFIRTDPADAFNPEANAPLNKWRNLFNWRSDTLKTYHPAGGWGNEILQLPSFTPNPFYREDNLALRHVNFYDKPTWVPADRENLDIHPADGWELVHRHLGYESNETTLANPIGNRNSPYFLLYNRYTGKLRLIAALNIVDPPDKLVTTLSFKRNPPPQLYEVSGLLGNYGGISQPLDQLTSVTAVSAPSLGVTRPNFFGADYQTSYDPCVCNTASDLEFSFSTLDSARIVLEGRLIGINTPLNTSGNSPLINRRDFLTAVYKNNFTVNGGLQTYHNIDSLVKKYDIPELEFFDKLAITALKTVFTKLGSVIDDKLLNKLTDNLLTKEFGGEEIFGIQLPDTIKAGLGLAGALTKTLIAELFPDRAKIPNISFLEAEGVFSGNMYNRTDLNTNIIKIAHPGSKESNNANVVWQNYPFYNEAMGTFAVLETPKVAMVEEEKEPCEECSLPRWQHKLQYSFQTLKYTFNPATEVDTSKTTILGALVFEVNNAKETYGSTVDWVTARNVGLVKAIPINQSSSKGHYITSFVPIGCLNQVVAQFVKGYSNRYPKWMNVKVNLRLMIETLSKPNRYGKVKKTLQILTYPVQLINSSDTEFVGMNYKNLNIYPKKLTVGNLSFSKDSTVFAWDTLIVNGSISVIAGKKVKLRSNGIVILQPNATLGIGVTVEKGLPFDCNSTIPPQTPQQVKDFCASNKYKAKVAAFIQEQAKNESIPPPNIHIQNILLPAFPNPTSSIVTFAYELAESSEVTFYVSNAMGERIEVLENKASKESGSYTINFDTSLLPAGVYFYTLETNGFKATKRLVVLR